MFFRKKERKFKRSDKVVFLKYKKTEPKILGFYSLPRAIINEIGTFVCYLDDRRCLVSFSSKDCPYIEYMIPVSLIKIYVKEPSHRLTKIFL